jgi:6-phosphofructokinase 2
MNPAVDQSSSTDFVTDERKLKCINERYDPGGGGLNVSRAIKILGGKKKAFYPAGGCSGDLLEQLLDREKINHSRISVEGRTRINIHLLEESTNRQYRFNMPGARLKEGDWRECLKILSEYSPHPDFIVASGSLPPGVPDDFFGKIAQLSKEINSKFILDTSGKPLQKGLEEGVYLIKPNLDEFSHLINEDIQNEEQILTKAKEFIEEGKCRIIVNSTGAAGTIVVTKNESTHIYAPIVPINSRIGAGDCMVAGITLKLALDESIMEAIKYGVAAGTAAVITPGTELCRKHDVERLFKKLKQV